MQVLAVMAVNVYLSGHSFYVAMARLRLWRIAFLTHS
jgi:hypothetical protein